MLLDSVMLNNNVSYLSESFSVAWWLAREDIWLSRKVREAIKIGQLAMNRDQGYTLASPI